MHLWHVTERGWVVSDVLDQPITPMFKGPAVQQITTNLSHVKHLRTVKISGTTVLSLLEDITPHTQT